MKTKKNRLQKQWAKRCKTYASAENIKKEARKLDNKADKLFPQIKEHKSKDNIILITTRILQQRANILFEQATLVQIKADLTFARAVLKTYGNIGFEWADWHEDARAFECHLENGEVYVP